MRSLNTRRLASLALGLIVVGCVWFFFAPRPIGGSTSYVVTDGISMEPRFHTGDLAVVRSQSSYHVGEIAAYYSKEFHTIVLHRIIAIEGGRYAFKGDNNNFIDFEHPARSQLIGALWIHVPGAGATLKSLRSPALIGALFGIGVLLLAGTLYTQRRRLRGRERRAGERGGPAREALPLRSSEPAAGVLALGLLALLPFVALALLAFTRPSAARKTVSVPYRQSAIVSYSADAPPGPVYAGDRAVTGDPIFTHVLSEVEFNFAYLFHTTAAHSIGGRASLDATVSAPSGWQTTLQLGQPTYFHGDRAMLSARLDLTSLLALLRGVAAMTQVDGGSYTLTLIPHVSTGGSVAGAPLHATFAPPITFGLNQFELQPPGTTAAGTTGAGGAAAGVASQFTPSGTGTVISARYAPQVLSLGPLQLSVATARALALVGIAVVLCAMLAALALLSRGPRRDEAAAIRQRYSHLIVPVERVWQIPGVAVIDVADMDALVHIAEHYDRSILCERTPEGEAFWVTDESGQFRYLIGAAAAAVCQPVPAEALAPLEVPVPDAQLFTQELNLGGGVISAYAAQEAPVAAPPEPEPLPEPVPEPLPAAQGDWREEVLADAVLLGGEDWRLACESAGMVFAAPRLAGS